MARVRDTAGSNGYHIEDRGAVQAVGADLITTECAEEMAAYDALPRLVREAIDQAANSITATTALTHIRAGAYPETVASIIRRVDRQVAEAQGTIPGASYEGRPLVLVPRPRRRRLTC